MLGAHRAWAAPQGTQSSKTSPPECCTVKEKMEGERVTACQRTKIHCYLANLPEQSCKILELCRTEREAWIGRRCRELLQS